MNDRHPPSPHLDWELVPGHFRDVARQAYERRLVAETLAPVPPVDRLRFVDRNADPLLADDLFEDMLYVAWVTGVRGRRAERLGQRLFARANRERLRSLGQPLPGPRSSYTLYRVAGLREESGSCLGFEWTLSLDTATRSLLVEDGGGRVDGVAIWAAEVEPDAILLYVNRHGEAKVVVDTDWRPESRRSAPHEAPFRPRVLTRIGRR